MRLIARRAVPLALAALLAAAEAAAQCSQYAIEQMRRAGIPEWEIQRRCGPPRPGQTRSIGPQAVQQGARCITPAVSCDTPTGPVGAPCWCATPLGSVAGTIAR